MPQLRINLLGPPQVQWDQASLEIPRRMLRAMLFYLACQPGGVGRAELLPLFWPNLPEDESRRRLRTALAKLRASLPDPYLLTASQDEVSLDFQRVTVDVRLYRELGQRSYQASLQFPIHQPLPEGIYTQMVRAAALWRSPRFLAGANLPASTEFDHWLSSFSQMLESSRMALLHRLADHSAAAGDLEAALMWARPYLLVNELDEDLQAHVIDWLVNLGRRSEALSYCTHAWALFQDSPGGAPPVLAQAIRRARSLQRSLPEEAGAWLPEPSAGAAFAGRAEWMEELRLAFRRGGMVCLSGEAGVGKTRLLYEFYRSLEPEPLLLLAQAGDALADLPFQPLLGALRRAAKERDWARLNPHWLHQLLPLLPELARYLPEAAVLSPGSPQDAPSLYEALHQFLVQLTQARRVLFVLENAHSCDESTLAALAYLLEQGFFERRGLLVLAYRPEEQTSTLSGWLHRLTLMRAPLTLSLPPLDEPAIRELVLAVFRHLPAPDLVPRLLRGTGGNPLFLTETIQALLERSAHPGGELDRLERLPVAGSLNTLLQARLRRLRPQTRRLLEMAAVLGSEFALDLLEACAQATPEQVTEALEELEQARLVAYAPHLQPAGGYAFVHAQVPQAILEALSPARRRLLHRRAAHALEQRPAAQAAGAAELAGHYEAAGDLPAAVEAWLHAARYDFRLFSPAEAYRAYARAGQLVLRLGDQAPEALFYRLYSAWGEAAFALNDTPTQKQVYTTLLALGQGRGSPLLVGAALSGLANAHFPAPIQDLAPDKIEQAIFYLRQAGDRRELAEALHRRGTILIQLGRYAEAVQSAGEAVELACCEPALAATYYGAALRQQTGLLLQGLPRQMKDAALKTLAEANAQGNAGGAAQAHMTLAWAECHLGDPAAALQHFALGRLQAEAAHLPFVRSYLLMMAAQAELILGHLDESWQHIEEMLAAGRRFSAPGMLFQAFLIQGLLYLALAAFKPAGESFRQALSGAPSPYERLSVEFALGLARAGLGEGDSVLQELGPILAQSRQSGLGYVFLPATLAQAWLLCQRGQALRALELLDQLEPELEQRSQRLLGVFASLARALAEWQAGQSEDAWLLCLRAGEAARLAGFPLGELLAFKLLVHSGGEAGAGLRQRAGLLLEELGQHTSLPELAPLFERFSRSLLNPGE